MGLSGQVRSAMAVLAIVLGAALPAQADIVVISPGVISNSGLRDVAAAFEKKTGITVILQVDGMGTILQDIRSRTPAADVVMLPMDLMGSLALSAGLQPNSFAPLGRVEIGLFAKPSFNSHPDISTVAALAATMRAASAVFYSDPASGSMQAGMNDRMLKRPEFSGVKAVPVKGDAEPALKRGEGDARAMGLGLIHGVHSASNAPTDNPYLIGVLPAVLDMHMDMATAISARSSDSKDAAAFIGFALSEEMRPVWKRKGVDRY